MRQKKFWFSMLLLLVAAVVGACRPSPGAGVSKPELPPAKVSARFNLPASVTEQMPARLSRTGVLENLQPFKPSPRLVPYELNVSFWSDGTEKQRWMALPENGTIHFSPTAEWEFPAGTVFVKNFALPAEEGSARLETRILITDGNRGVFGATYEWRRDGSDADLVTQPLTERVNAKRNWYYPGPSDCQVCHTKVAGGVLGLKTRQLNRSSGAHGENQLAVWSRKGFFDPPVDPASIDRLPKLPALDDLSRSAEDRSRTYLDVNCANCHRPGGSPGNFDARFDTPLARQNLIGGPVMIDFGIDHARVIAPGDIWRSIALNRVETSDLTKMPPLAHQRFDPQGSKVLREWIQSLPGPRVLEPPAIEPKGGEYKGLVNVSLRHPEPGVSLHYTLDGSAPIRSSPIYDGPIELKEPATLRVRAYKEGMTRSITVQETFIPSQP